MRQNWLSSDGVWRSRPRARGLRSTGHDSPLRHVLVRRCPKHPIEQIKESATMVEMTQRQEPHIQEVAYKLTVVIPCYNEMATLRSCIARVMSIASDHLVLE